MLSEHMSLTNHGLDRLTRLDRLKRRYQSHDLQDYRSEEKTTLARVDIITRLARTLRDNPRSYCGLMLASSAAYSFGS